MLDENTQTQQGVALETLGYGDSGGAIMEVDTCNIYCNGELVYKIAPEKSFVTFIDENAPDGMSSIYYTEVRKSFPPKNFEYDSEEIEDDMIVNHLIWEREDDMESENIKAFYEIYRKKISEDEYVLIKSIEKVDGQDKYQYDDVIDNANYQYKINTYNVYERGLLKVSLLLLKKRLQLKKLNLRMSLSSQQFFQTAKAFPSNLILV